MERPLSAARKTSVEEQDSEEMASRVRQAIQRENDPVQSPELFSRNTVCLPHTVHVSPQLRPCSRAHLLLQLDISFHCPPITLHMYSDSFMD